MAEKATIKNWALDDRPREKLLLKGKQSLSNAELLAILIGSGNRNETAVALAKRILVSVNNKLSSLAKMSIAELMQFKGIGSAKAISIQTGLELGKRRHFETQIQYPVIQSSKDVFAILHPLLGDLGHEEFWVLYLNNANKVLVKEQLSKGGVTATYVDVRLLFKKALNVQAVAVIVCHNHPSGKLEPSKNDKDLTQKIQAAGNTLDIKLLDHLILTEKTYFSFADSQLL